MCAHCSEPRGISFCIAKGAPPRPHMDKMSKVFMSWCRKELSKALHSPVEDDLLAYLVSMEAEKDVREYLHDLLSASDVETVEVDVFMKEFFRHWCPPNEARPPPSDVDHQLVQEQILRPNREELVLYSKQVAGVDAVGCDVYILPILGHSSASRLEGKCHAHYSTWC